MNNFKNIIDDTLKGPHGKWSRKSLTAFASFLMAVLVGLFIVIEPLFLEPEQTVNQYAITVFLSFLGMSGGTLGLTVIDKMKKYGGDGEQ